MKTFAKIALIVAGVVVVLITAAALLVPRLVDPNQYKDRIATLAKESTGRDLAITGDISLSVFPWLGAEIGAVTLGNAPGFEADTFAGFQGVKVKVKLLPLLSKRIEADVITIEGLVLNLETDADGRTNWDDLTQTAPAEDAAAPPAEAPSDPTALLADLAIGGLEILDARVSWNDRRSGTSMALQKFNLKTSAVNLADPVTLAVGFDLDAGALGLAGTVDTGARIEFDLAGGRYAARDLSLTAALTGEAIPGGSVSVALAGEASFDAGAQTFDLAGLRLEATGLTLADYTAGARVEASGAGDLGAGTVRIDSLRTTATLANEGERITAELSAAADADLNAQRFEISQLRLSLPELSLKGLQGSLESTQAGSATADLSAGTVVLDTPNLSGTLSGEAVPGGGAPVAFDLKARGDLNTNTFAVAPVTLTLADMTATASLDLALPESGPRVSGALAVAPFNLRDLLTRLGTALPQMADADALSTAQISMTLSATDQSAAIDGLSIRLDDTTLSGTLAVDNFEAPEATLALSLDRLQLERYLPPGEGAQTPRLVSDVTLKGNVAADAAFEVFQVAGLALAGKLDKNLAFGVTADGARADLTEETISVDALSLTAGDMTLEAKAHVTAFSTEPAFSAELKTETFNLRRMLSDLDLMPETADAGAMSAVKLNATVSGTPDAVSVSTLKLRLDDTTVTGTADLALAPAPAYAFDIAVDSIDADRYLPPPAPEDSAQQKTGTAAASSADPTPLPVELLRDLALDGKLAVGNLKISKLTLSNIQFRAAAREGLLTLDPLAADLYDGACSAQIRLDARDQTPTLTLKTSLAGVQSGDLLADLQGKALLTGQASAEMDLSAAGADTDALLSSLGGTVSFTFTDGSVKGVDIVGKLCNTLMAVDAGSLKTEDLVSSALQKIMQKAVGTQTATTQAEADSTTFSELGGSMTFAGGVGTSDDLAMKSPLLRIQGDGSLDLPNQYLDYDATAYLVKSCQGQGGESTDDLKNVPIPVTISGPLAELKVKPNLTAGILEILTREQKKKSGSSATTSSEKKSDAADTQQEAPETVEDAVKGILQNLLKK